MSLEGRKFHFTRDEDGKIYAENEIETEIANREGWLLPPRKGERYCESIDVIRGIKSADLVWETTGELENGFPIYTLVLSESNFAKSNKLPIPRAHESKRE